MILLSSDKNKTCNNYSSTHTLAERSFNFDSWFLFSTSAQALEAEAY